VLTCPAIPPGQHVLTDFESASRHEWLLTDGIGGHAAGTASGAPTRRTHALLAAASPHGALTALLLRFEEKLAIGSAVHDLAAAFVGGRARAGSFAQLEAFTTDPAPRWRWRFDDGTVIEKRLRLVDGHAAMVATWTLVEGANVKLSVAPLLTARPVHGLLRETNEFRGAAQGIPGRVRLETVPGQPGVTLWHNGAFLPARGWARSLAYPLEFASEDDGTAPEMHEDAFLPGWVQSPLAESGATLHLVVSPEEALFRSLASEGRLGAPPARTLNDCVRALDRGARERRDTWRRHAFAGADLTARQASSAHGGAAATLARRPEPLVDPDDALAGNCATRLLESTVRRNGRVTLAPRAAGGTERGTDVLRAAAALVTLRAFEPARQIAQGYIEYLDEGLAPESFDPADGTPRYGDPEPSLWLVHLVDLLARRSSVPPANDPFLRDVAWPALEGVLQHLRQGSRHGVHCDREGLLWAGEGDAACARAGTNALWFHALVAMAQLGKLLGRRENAAFYLAWAHELQRCFVERFWDEHAGALFESVGANGARRGVSPAQLLAVSLPPALLPPALATRLLATLERELLVPSGLRPRPDESPADAAWLGAWASATARTRGRDADTLAWLSSRLERSGDAARLDPLVAADVLRAWVEEADRAGMLATR
jgi:hypothetical protein